MGLSMGEARGDSAAPSNHLLLSGDADKAEKAQALVSENNLCRQYEEKVRPCIDLIDSLRALGVEQDLALPAIAVIGDQSSGKSSVLEALSGVALPRGSGIVTRCPLVLKLKRLKPEEEWKGKVSYMGIEEDITDASQVEEEIRKAQNFIAGDGLGIKDELISLEISSPTVPDLTLIDLPGITRVPVGNQPADIGRQIKRLIRNYIQKDETINLVVVPSNVDIATTEALSMANEVDPDGDRTIGILTKPDLVDRGTEDKVVDVVQNLVCHLKKGYMIVKCRGQQDIQERLSLTDALQREKAFFEDHPQFRVLLKDRKATVPCLAERLSEELIAHICKSLPLLESQIKDLHQRTTEELQKYGMDIPEDDSEKTFFLIEKINAFNQDISAIIEGEENVGMDGTRLFARLRQQFQSWSSMIEKHFAKAHVTLQRARSPCGPWEEGHFLLVPHLRSRGPAGDPVTLAVLKVILHPTGHWSWVRSIPYPDPLSSVQSNGVYEIPHSSASPRSVFLEFCSLALHLRAWAYRVNYLEIAFFMATPA
ncbi:PREDICTED: interferon-induced GTP-binding protein Mx2-like isoform X2 [Chinchilla lanigera]|uniref:interferon-induced GTP-binding protein Mx2-like isoform X2 n=1 Tax=Chinchilla lanigera TaxID=34839 RepID=UPI000698FE96|nr:PREDICTED: interferon-induced GTP-binding protein Mx2-like isoform X2 [Chinchilla lanigera]